MENKYHLRPYNHEVTCDFPVRYMYFSARRSDAACLQFLPWLLDLSKNAYLSGSPSDVLAILHVMNFGWWLKIIYQFETFNIMRLLSEILHQLRYYIHHKNQRMICIFPYQRVLDFFHHFYLGFTRRFASQLLRKSSHPSVQYRINHRNLLAVISINTMNTH